MPSRKPPPFEFVLEALASADPFTRPMFGCLAVYIEEKIVCVLRDKQDYPSDNGVWLATVPEHHESLKSEFPSMRSIEIFGPGVTGWQNLPEESKDFESSALRACELMLVRDPRIGKIPKPRKGKSKAKPKLKKKTKK